MYPTLTKQIVDDHISELRRTARASRFASLRLVPVRRSRRAR